MTRMGGPPKLLRCTCCGAVKKTTDFSSSPRSVTGRAPACLDCGVWLHLLRQVFGDIRDYDKNRRNQADRYRREKARRAALPTAQLMSVWR